MEIETLRKSNVKLWVSKPAGKEKYYKTGRELVINLLCEMAKLSIKYYENDLIDFPYRYGERQLTSLILPALSKISNGAVLSECPIKRNRHSKRNNINLDNATGRLDYWCMYNGVAFAIEVKHSFDAFNTPICKENIDKWNDLNVKQLPSLKEELKRKWEKNTIIPIGLHFITSYSYSNKPLSEEEQRSLINEYKKDVPNLLESLNQDVCQKEPSKTTPDILACWMPTDNMILSDPYLTTPGLIVMGKVQPIHWSY